MKEFDIKRDIQIIDQGGFWCEACLTGKPMDDQSPDERYCLSCYDFLNKEAELLTGSPKWKPIKRLQTSVLQAKSTGETLVYDQLAINPILSTLEDKKPRLTKLLPRELKEAVRNKTCQRNLSGS